jgi:hypothetical protein
MLTPGPDPASDWANVAVTMIMSSIPSDSTSSERFKGRRDDRVKSFTHALAPKFVSQPPKQQLPEEVPDGRCHLDPEILVLGELVSQGTRIYT